MKTILIILLFFVGLSLGYSGVSVQEVSKIIQHYAKKGDEIIQDELDDLERKRILRRYEISEKRKKRIKSLLDEEKQKKYDQIINEVIENYNKNQEEKCDSSQSLSI